MHNFVLIFRHLHLSDISALEIALGQEGREYIQAYYQLLQAQYFPNIKPFDGSSLKQHFKETVLDMLQKMKKEYGISLSAHAFYEAATGRSAPLVRQASFEQEKECLLAIQYSYHAFESIERASVLKKIAFLFSYRKEYIALEKLVDKNSKMLLALIQHHPIIFYASYGHLQKVTALLFQAQQEADFAENTGKALVEAAKKAHIEVVKVLLKEREPLKIAIEYTGSALVWASRKGYAKIVSELLQCCGKEIFAEEKRRAFQEASNAKHLEVVRALRHDAGEEIDVVKKKRYEVLL